jgi:hypothetical protein
MEQINIDLPPYLGSMLSDAEKQFVKLRSSGSSIRNIAKTMKKSPSTICEWNKKFSRNILSERNKAFCELQKKVIELKNKRIDFLKNEIERVIAVLKKCSIKESGGFFGYDSLFARFVKISNILSAYEHDILNVGINFKDNISPESDLTTEQPAKENGVTPENNSVTPKTDDKVTEKTNVNLEEKQNCNTGTLPKKYFCNKQIFE